MHDLLQDTLTFKDLGILGICMALLFFGMRELPKHTENNTLKAVILIGGIVIFVFLCVVILKIDKNKKNPKKQKEDIVLTRDTATTKIDTTSKIIPEKTIYEPLPNTNVLSSRFVAGNWHARSDDGYINESISFEYYNDYKIKVTSDCERSKIVSCFDFHEFPYDKISSMFMTSITKRWITTLRLKRNGDALGGELKIEYLDPWKFTEDVPIRVEIYNLTFRRK